MPHLIGNVEMQGEPCKVVQLLPEPKVLPPYKSRFRRRREALGLAAPSSEPVADLVMLRADVVDTSPCEMDVG